MSDPIGDAARAPVGGPAAAGTDVGVGTQGADSAEASPGTFGPDASVGTSDAGATPGANATVGADSALGAADVSPARPASGLNGTPPRVVVCPLLVLVGGTGASVEADAGGTSGEAGSSPEVGSVSTDVIAVRPATENRCAASNPSAPVSISQQRFVCLDADHVECPRLLRAMASPRAGGARAGRAAAIPVGAAVGANVAAGQPSTTGTSLPRDTSDVVPGSASPASAVDVGSPATPVGTIAGHDAALSSETAAASSTAGTESGEPATDRPSSRVVPVAPVTRSSRRSGARPAGSRPTPTLIAGAILAAALLLTIAFVSMRGGLALPVANPSPTAVVSPSAPATVVESPSPSALPTPSPSPTESLPSSPSPIASVPPASAPPPASPSLPAAYQGLKPCSDRPDCYLYRVRSGDSLTAIAARFGITLAALKQANPEITSPNLLHVGDSIRVPLPPR